MSMSSEVISIRKFISQHCLGYSSDFKTTFFEDEVELVDGRIVIIYTTIKHGEVLTESHSFHKPLVSVPMGGSS